MSCLFSTFDDLTFKVKKATKGVELFFRINFIYNYDRERQGNT